MPRYLSQFCDAVSDGFFSAPEEMSSRIWTIFCSMDAEIKKVRDLKDTKRCEKLARDAKNILLILKLFPIELQLAIANGYSKMICGFLSLYLDFKLVMYENHDRTKDPAEGIKEVCKDVFLILKEEPASVWGVVVTSQALSNLDVLREIMKSSLEATKKKIHDHEQYIRMIFVLQVFLSSSRRSRVRTAVDDMIKEASLITPPNGLGDWMIHHFPGYGWKGMTDQEVHAALLKEKQPRGFTSKVFMRISNSDTLMLDQPLRNPPMHTEESTSSSETETGSQARETSPVAGPSSRVSSTQSVSERAASTFDLSTDEETEADLQNKGRTEKNHEKIKVAEKEVKVTKKDAEPRRATKTSKLSKKDEESTEDEEPKSKTLKPKPKKKPIDKLAKRTVTPKIKPSKASDSLPPKPLPTKPLASKPYKSILKPFPKQPTSKPSTPKSAAARAAIEQETKDLIKSFDKEKLIPGEPFIILNDIYNAMPEILNYLNKLKAQQEEMKKKLKKN